MFDGLDNAYPLTAMQQGLLYEVLRQPDTDVYVAYIILDIKGELNEATLYSAWESAVGDHETLRTRFVWEGLDEPLQLVNTESTMDWSVSCIKSTADVGDVVAMERRRKLSLSDAPPTRFRLLRLNSNHSVLVWTVHHLLADDWSTPLVLQSVASHYGRLAQTDPDSTADSTAKAQKLEFANYVEWLGTADLSKHKLYWKTVLENCRPSPLKLMAGHSNRSAHTRHEHPICRADTAAIAKACQRHGVTLSSYMHAAWALVLARLTGAAAPLFGTSVSGRTCPLPDIESTVGLFLNTLPTSIGIDVTQTLEDYLQSVQRQLFAQLEHEHLPLSALQQLAPATEQNQLFESVLVVESHGPDLCIDVPGSDISFSNVRYVTDSNYPLTVLVFPGEAIALQLVSPPGEYADGVVSQVAQELAAVLSDLASDQLTHVGTLVNNQSKRFNAFVPKVNLHDPAEHPYIDDWIDKTCQQYPQATAVVDGINCYSYAQLADTAQRCATAIDLALNSASVVGDQHFVGVYLDRGFEQIAAILGVLNSGLAYVPLDPQWPQARLSAMLESAGISLLITASRSASLLTDRSLSLVLMDQLPERTESRLLRQWSGDSAYMIYTSGSSGQPKGVVVSHANLIYSTAARQQYYPNAPQRYLLLSSFAFDSSVAGIFWTLCTGGALILPEPDKERDIHELAQLIEQHSVTHTLCLPSLYGLLLRYAPPNSLTSLNTVIVAGEACPARVVKLHQQTLPDTTLFNEYGPTEATVWSSVALLSKLRLTAGDQVPIGFAVPGTTLSVVDHTGKPCPPGVVGEIQITGPGVVAGYYGDSALTAQRFAQPGTYRSGDDGVLGENGTLYFVGRVDDQIKVRGHRIEPAEIELRTEQHAFVDQAVCTLVAENPDLDNPASARLVCFYTLSEAGKQTAGQLTGTNVVLSNQACRMLDAPELDSLFNSIHEQSQQLLQAELPQQFSVARFVALNQIPRLPNGKVDHSLFPNPFGLSVSSLENHPTSTSNEPHSAALCALLAQLLGLESINDSDNFFSLGGDSLTAIRFVAAAREQGLALNIPMLTRHATMAQLAAVLHSESASTDKAGQSAQAESAHGLAPLTPIQRWFFSSAHRLPSHWNMACEVHLTLPVSSERVVAAISQCVSEQPVLATQFIEDAGEILQRIPELPPQARIQRSLCESNAQQALLTGLLAQQSEFDLASGDLLRFVLLENADQSCLKLGMVAHHLVTDALSNWQLASRIETYCAQSALPLSLALSETGSYRDWAQRLHKAARENSLAKVTGDLPVSCPERIYRERDTLEEHLVVEAELVSALKQGCQKHSVGLHECVLLAAIQGFDSAIVVDVETHGRDILQSEIDVSTSVGWFSSFYTLSVQPLEADITFRDIARFKDWFRHRRQQTALEFPADPVGFFNTHKSSELRVLYNFLALATGGPSANSVNVQPILHADFRDADSLRAHAVELLVTDVLESEKMGGVRLTLRFDNQLADTQALVSQTDSASWSTLCLQSLEAISTALMQSVPQISSEDFPDSGMDTDELNSFLDGFD